MNVSDTTKPTKIIGLTLLVFEGEIERDEHGNITNKLRESICYEAPLEERNGAELESREHIIERLTGA